MFGLKSFFAALARLTAAITQSAELFEQANTHLTQQLGIDHPAAPALDHEPAKPNRKRS